MDTKISASETARRLGTSVPRVKRALVELDLHVQDGPHGRVQLGEEDVAALAAHLGVDERVPGLSRSEVQVLAALARAPLGLVSARAVARRAGISATAAGRALDRLVERGLVRRTQEWVAAGHARQLEIYRVAFDAPEWPQIAAKLARVRPPVASPHARDRRVPRHLRHLFWNTASSQLDVDHAGGYIARRLLSTRDLPGIAWGASHLAAADWENAARARGLDGAQRAMALNLARRRRHRP